MTILPTKRIAIAALLVAAGPGCAPAAELKPQTVAAFDRYTQQAVGTSKGIRCGRDW